MHGIKIRALWRHYSKGGHFADPFKPTVLAEAEAHLRASSIGEEKAEYSPCPCCGLNSLKEPAPFCKSITSMWRYGLMLPFFFHTVHIAIAFILLSFAVYGFPLSLKCQMIYTCLIGNCNNKLVVECFRTNQRFLHILALLLFALLIVLKNLLGYFLRQYCAHIDAERISPADYTLYVSGLPLNSNHESVVQFFCEQLGREKDSIVKVNRIYRVGTYLSLQRRYFDALLRLKRAEQSGAARGRIVELRQKATQIHSESEAQRRAIESLPEYFTGNAFVTFRDERTAQEAEEHFQRTRSAIKVSPACEPGEVLWANFGLNPSSKHVMRGLSSTLACLLILISLGGVVTLRRKTWQNTPKNESHKLIRDFLISVCISLFRYIIRNVIVFFSSRELFKTLSTQQFSIIIKLSISSFVNTGLVIFFSFTFGYQERVFVVREFLQSVANLFIVSPLIDCGTALAFPQHLFKLIRRRLLVRALRRGEHVFQYEANLVFEQPPFDSNRAFVEVHYLSALAFFLLPIMPFSPLMVATHLFLLAVIYRINILRRTGLPREPTTSFILLTLSQFNLSFLIGAIAFAVSDFLLLGNVSALTFTLIILVLLDAIVQCFLFRRTIRRRILHNISYVSAQRRFHNDYDRLNPITQRAAVEEWFRLYHPRSLAHRSVVSRGGSQVLSELPFEPHSSEEREHQCCKEHIELLELNSSFAMSRDRIAFNPDNSFVEERAEESESPIEEESESFPRPISSNAADSASEHSQKASFE